MKPLGKCLKTTHLEKGDKKKALNNFLSRYRATPHSATGIAPGDIMFRHGYARDFPKNDTPDDQKVRDKLNESHKKRREKDEELNITRKEDHYEIGEEIFTRNNNKRKFDPSFGPHPMIITELQNGGATCRGKDGQTQWRHLDDIKAAPTTSKDREQVRPAERMPREAPATNQMRHGRASEATPQHSGGPTNQDDSVDRERRRSTRERKENPKYKDYIMM